MGKVNKGSVKEVKSHRSFAHFFLANALSNELLDVNGHGITLFFWKCKNDGLFVTVHGFRRVAPDDFY